MPRKQPLDKLKRELGAVAADLPGSIAPQLATLVASPPLTGDWIFEIKFK